MTVEETLRVEVTDQLSNFPQLRNLPLREEQISETVSYSITVYNSIMQHYERSRSVKEKLAAEFTAVRGSPV